MPVESNVYTLDEALSKIGFRICQGLLFIYAGLGWIAEAMELMLLSFIGPALKSKWGISSSEESLISTVVFASMLIGAYSWGFISDTYGRRKILLGVVLITSGAGMLSSFYPNYTSLVTLRGLVGIGLGAAVRMFTHRGFWSLFLLQVEALGWSFSQLSGRLGWLSKLHSRGSSCLF